MGDRTSGSSSRRNSLRQELSFGAGHGAANAARAGSWGAGDRFKGLPAKEVTPGEA